MNPLLWPCPGTRINVRPSTEASRDRPELPEAEFSRRLAQKALAGKRRGSKAIHLGCLEQ